MLKMLSLRPAFWMAALPLLGSGCLAVTTPLPGEEVEPVAVVIPFQALVGQEPFFCGGVYGGLGTTGTEYQPMEFRLYVHNLRLIDAEDNEIPVTLDNDGAFQGDGLALLDFADNGGLCTNGTAATHTELTGTVPPGEYVGLRFTLGVPFDKNHQDATVAPAPLNDLGLFWGWQFGYLFARIEGTTTGLPQGHNFHLGSTGCTPPAPGQNGTSGCTSENRVEVDLPGFSINGEIAVNVDLAALFSGSDLDTNAPDTAVGCMSFPGDTDCPPIFSRLGLPFDGSQPGTVDPSVFYLGGHCAALTQPGQPSPIHCR